MVYNYTCLLHPTTHVILKVRVMQDGVSVVEVILVESVDDSVEISSPLPLPEGPEYCDWIPACRSAE